MDVQSLRVAVADDNSTERAAVKEMLEDLGHHVVVEARTGEQLTTRVHEQQPDLVVTDLHMLGKDGLQAAEAIATNNATPIVVMSTSHSSESVQKALRPTNIVGYIAKPFGAATLDGMIRFAFGLFRRLRGLETRLCEFQRSQSDRELIERAKKVLMNETPLSESEAHRKLQKMASSSNKKMIEVARAIVDMSKVDRT